MVRFSCFYSHFHSNKPKKTVHLSDEAMQKIAEDCSENQALKDFKDSSGLDALQLKVQGVSISDNSSNNVICSTSIDCGWKAPEINSSNKWLHHSGCIKKSLSLGSGLDRGGKASMVNDSEDEIDGGYSCDGSLDHDKVVPVAGKDPEISILHQYQEAAPSDSLQGGSDLLNNGSIFSIGDTQQSEKGHENYDIAFSGPAAGACESSDLTPHTPPVLVKSSSLPNLGSFGRHSAFPNLAPCSRSSEDLIALHLRQKGAVIHEVITGVIHDQEQDDNILNNEKGSLENQTGVDYDSYNYVGPAKDWIVPVMDEVNADKRQHGESSAVQWKELPAEDFKIKRIKEWVVDLQHCDPLEETIDLSNVDHHQVQRDATVIDKLPVTKFDGKTTPGVEAAKKYISSLSATATTAQLANHGLAVIPFLGAFISLRALNLSGNGIVRITAGALPRGLHILNLSTNNISTIEGLRELTRLRVLDLSFNRIVRIGHGLASCSSLKELYLAGNKISEVEGLHRLLKLNVLDLRFNKISTAKCLGQLAANYNSLQAISLEGNPAQKNVGDEQVKKYLLGLLPHLAYFNRQPIKAGSLKDVADWSARLGMSTDRGLRSDHKTLRKGNHSGAHRTSFSSSIHSHRSQAVAPPRPSKDRTGRMPPTRTKSSTHHFNLHDFSSRLQNLNSELSMRRSRSEGTLAAL